MSPTSNLRVAFSCLMILTCLTFTNAVPVTKTMDLPASSCNPIDPECHPNCDGENCDTTAADVTSTLIPTTSEPVKVKGSVDEEGNQTEPGKVEGLGGQESNHTETAKVKGSAGEESNQTETAKVKGSADEKDNQTETAKVKGSEDKESNQIEPAKNKGSNETKPGKVKGPEDKESNKTESAKVKAVKDKDHSNETAKVEVGKDKGSNQTKPSKDKGSDDKEGNKTESAKIKAAKDKDNNQTKPAKNKGSGGKGSNNTESAKVNAVKDKDGSRSFNPTIDEISKNNDCDCESIKVDISRKEKGMQPETLKVDPNPENNYDLDFLNNKYYSPDANLAPSVLQRNKYNMLLNPAGSSLVKNTMNPPSYNLNQNVMLSQQDQNMIDHFLGKHNSLEHAENVDSKNIENQNQHIHGNFLNNDHQGQYSSLPDNFINIIAEKICSPYDISCQNIMVKSIQDRIKQKCPNSFETNLKAPQIEFNSGFNSDGDLEDRKPFFEESQNFQTQHEIQNLGHYNSFSPYKTYQRESLTNPQYDNSRNNDFKFNIDSIKCDLLADPLCYEKYKSFSPRYIKCQPGDYECEMNNYNIWLSSRNGVTRTGFNQKYVEEFKEDGHGYQDDQSRFLLLDGEKPIMKNFEIRRKNNWL